LHHNTTCAKVGVARNEAKIETEEHTMIVTVTLVWLTLAVALLVVPQVIAQRRDPR
jgi:hypothetical protein